jgi:outer membrane lipoprotein-sorting protein
MKAMLVSGVLAAAACAMAQTTASAPAPAATTSATASAPTTTSAPAKAVMDALNAMEAAGERYKTIRATIDYNVDMAQTGDQERRGGYVAYKAADGNEPARFRISFDTLRLGEGALTKDQLDYIFDGQWLTVAKHRIKQMTRYQVAAAGEKVEPMRLGKGPFPVPFGQKADDVLAHFEVTTRDARKSDPPGTTYLKLLPRTGRQAELSAKQVEMWVDVSSGLPAKIISLDKSENLTTVVFSDIKTGAQVDASLFAVQRPAGWEYVVKPLGEQ